MPLDPRHESDHIFVLRHTLMNPWRQAGSSASGEGDTYIDRYWAYLAEVIDEVLAEGGWR